MGAAIISSTRLACAAHCTQGSYYQIRVGSTDRRNGGTVVRIASIRNHPGYNNGAVGTFSNDVSTLQPAEALVFNNETISAIDLARTGDFTGATATITGWKNRSFRCSTNHAPGSGHWS